MKSNITSMRAVMCTLALTLSAPSMASDTWVAIKDRDLKITAGSPLDFSGLLPAGPAGSMGRIIAGPAGKFVFANTPEKKAALNCGSLVWGGATGGFPDHQTADAYVAQLKLHGYNLIRFHFLDMAMMSGQMVSNDFNVTQLDHLHYLLKALKDAGIYWMMDMMTSDSGTVGNVPDRWSRRLDQKFRVNLDSDEAAKQSWRDEVSALYNTVNPYTHQTILSDPALAAIVLVNEGGINFLTAVNGPDASPAKVAGKFDPRLKAPFNAFLKAKYGTDANLRMAWSAAGADANDPLGADESLDTDTIQLPKGNYISSSRMTDLQSFITTQEIKTVGWMSDYVRALGYTGPITSLNNWFSREVHRSRAALDAIDMHAYFNEMGSFVSGMSSKQSSVTEDPVHLFTNDLTSARHAGKPFTVTEYGQVFFNQYRYEASALVPALASLQGWDYICMHGEGPIDLGYVEKPDPVAHHKNSIQPYAPGLDPVLRAGETLSALLFLRGDVAPSPNRLTLQLTDTTMYAADAANQNNYSSSGLYDMPESIKMLGLLTAFELRFPGEDPTPPSRTPGIRQNVKPDNNLVKDRVKKLFTDHILGPNNLTNPIAGTYQSDTEQLTMNSATRRFTVVTDRTEAITSAQALSGVSLKALKIASLDGPALLSASTLGQDTLTASDNILLIFATDAINTGMTFTDATRTVLKDQGTAPALVRQGIANATLSLSHRKPMRLLALDLKGNRQGEIALAMTETPAGADWSFTLDNVAQSFGPTTFFLLEKKPAQ